MKPSSLCSVRVNAFQVLLKLYILSNMKSLNLYSVYVSIYQTYYAFNSEE